MKPTYSSLYSATGLITSIQIILFPNDNTMEYLPADIALSQDIEIFKDIINHHLTIITLINLTYDYCYIMYLILMLSLYIIDN